jgi:hypothetical protein
MMPSDAGEYVRPHSKGRKNDSATKTADQLDLQTLHRVRERLVSQRTGIRGTCFWVARLRQT